MTQQHSAGHQPNGFALPRDPERAVKSVISVIEDLQHIYAEETDALERSKARKFLDLQDQKFTTAQQYQTAIEQLLARKEDLKKASPESRDKLKMMQRNFSELASKNMASLKRMGRTIDRLSERIRTAAKDEINKHRAVSYSESGRVNDLDSKSISTGLNETA